jgi:hypothetical protein
MTQKLVCVIDRSKWVRATNGVYKGESLLLNSRGNSCCLGMLGLACGMDKDMLLLRAGPASLYAIDNKYPPNIEWSPFMGVNDDLDTTDAEKEAKLMELAQANGFEFQFVGE